MLIRLIHLLGVLHKEQNINTLTITSKVCAKQYSLTFQQLDLQPRFVRLLCLKWF